MKKLLLFISFTLLAASVLQAQQTDSLCEARIEKMSRVISNDSMKIFTNKCKIPRKLKRALKKELKKQELWDFWECGFLRFANPGAPYRSTDVVINPFLTNRQLVFGGKMKGYSFIVYYKGGRGKSLILAFFDSKTSEITLFYPSRVHDYTELKQALSDGKVECF